MSPTRHRNSISTPGRNHVGTSLRRARGRHPAARPKAHSIRRSVNDRSPSRADAVDADAISDEKSFSAVAFVLTHFYRPSMRRWEITSDRRRERARIRCAFVSFARRVFVDLTCVSSRRCDVRATKISVRLRNANTETSCVMLRDGSVGSLLEWNGGGGGGDGERMPQSASAHRGPAAALATDRVDVDGIDQAERCEQLHRRLKRIVKARGALDMQEAEALREAQKLALWRRPWSRVTCHSRGRGSSRVSRHRRRSKRGSVQRRR